jgi:hypothetical protein
MERRARGAARLHSVQSAGEARDSLLVADQPGTQKPETGVHEVVKSVDWAIIHWEVPNSLSEMSDALSLRIDQHWRTK